MANHKHLYIFENGEEGWSQWRAANQQITPDLSETDFSNIVLADVDLSGTDLRYTKFVGAFLLRARLENANLFNVDFRHANLQQANFSEAKLGDANLKYADLSEAKFIHAGFLSANLSYTKLNGADFSNAVLYGANLQGASLVGANLAYADLSNADLSEADFSEAEMIGTTLGNNDLSKVKGLDTVLHHGASTIGIDTLFRSGGRIPEGFLRGCGVPEDFILYISSLIGVQQVIQFHSCFISYSHKDEEFAQRLYSRMRDAKLRVWYAPKEMKGGEKLHEQIFRAIQIHDKLLLVLSENSLQSEWVATEIRRARKSERETNKRKLFPIRLVDFDVIQRWEHFDAESGKDLGIELREYFIPDFTNWKDHDAFEAAFERLLRDLKAEEKKDNK
jgi:uncharacterized protein YjbI with pentapeptide repeats